MFIYLIGPSGSGKTVVGRELAEKMRWPSIDIDDLIETQVGRSVAAIFDEEGEIRFRVLESEAVDKTLREGTHGVVATGGGLPAIEGMMGKLANTGITMYLKASLDELWTRLTVDPYQLDKRPLLRDRGRAGLEEMLLERASIYESAKFVIITDGMSVSDIVSRVINELWFYSETTKYVYNIDRSDPNGL